jgi:gliding motility-associated-like protein
MTRVIRLFIFIVCTLMITFSSYSQGTKPHGGNADPTYLTTSVDTISLCPGDFWLPVRLQNASNIGSINLVLCFNPSVIQYLNQFLFPIVYGFPVCNWSGCLRFGWYSVTPFSMVDDTILSLKFHYSGGVTPLTWDLNDCSYSDITGSIIDSAVFISGEVNSVGYTSVITSQPQSVSLCDSSSAVISAVVEYGLSYQWQISTDGGTSWNDMINNSIFSGVNTTDLNITSIPFSYNGNQVRLKVIDICNLANFSNPATISVQLNPIINAGIDDSICAGSTYTFNGTGNDYSNLTWISTGSGSFADNGTLTPTYTPSATDILNGNVVITLVGDGISPCPLDRDTMILTIIPIPDANAGNDTIICYGGTATLHGSGGVSYTWGTTPPQYTQTITVSPTVNTTYYLTVSNYGCDATDEVNVTLQTGAVVQAGLDGSICADQTFSLNGVVQNVSDFMWSTSGDGYFSDASVLNPVYNPGTLDIANGSVYLVLGGLPNAPCLVVDYDSLLLTIIPLPDANAGPNITICKGDPATLVATGGTSYVWNTVPPMNNDTLIVSPIDTTFYVVTVSNALCSSSDTVVVNVLPLPQITLTHDTMICSGDSVVLAASGGLSYIWSNGEFISSIVVFPTVTTTYTVTVTDIHTCHSSASVTITVNASLNSSVSPANPNICEGGNITLTASASHPSIFEWAPGTGLSNTVGPVVIASPDKTTQYNVTATDAMGCSSVSSVVLIVYQNPPVEVHPPLYDLCKGDTLVMTAYGASSYFWSPPAGLSANNLPVVLASPKQSITYELTGTDQHNCSTTVTAVINVLPVPVITLPESIYICRGENYLLNAEGHIDSCTYSWQDGSTESYFYATNPGLYYVTVNRLSCSVTDSVLVKACSEVWIPNAFSPNNDGINDLFYVKNTEDLTEFHLTIYNRWGERVFYTDNPFIPWDGNNDGKRCPTGVYHYVIEYVGQGNVLLEQEGKKYGQITLFR